MEYAEPAPHTARNSDGPKNTTWCARARPPSRISGPSVNALQASRLVDTLQGFPARASVRNCSVNRLRRRPLLAQIDEGLDFSECVIIERKWGADSGKVTDDAFEADVVADRPLLR